MAKSVTDLLTLKMKNIKMAMVLSIMLNRKDGWIEKRDTMKKFEEIVNEIKVLSNEIQNVKNDSETENKAWDIYWHDTFDGLNLKEKVEKRKEIEEEYSKKQEEHIEKIAELERVLTNKRLKMKVLIFNTQTSLMHEVLPTFIEVWNKYVGKRCGEKTYEKIKNEIKEKTNCSVYLSRFNYSIDINYLVGGYVSYDEYTKIEVYFKPDYKVLIDNVIQHITMDDFKTDRRYVENVDEHIEEMLKLYDEAQEKKKELEKAYAKFNTMVIGDIKHLYMHEDSRSII